MIDNSDLDALLDEREGRYGDYIGVARVSQGINEAMRHGKNWAQLRDCQKYSLEMVAVKIARILNGDPEYHDNWADILGYIRLVERGLRPPPTRTKCADVVVYGDRGQRLTGKPSPEKDSIREQIHLPLA